MRARDRSLGLWQFLRQTLNIPAILPGQLPQTHMEAPWAPLGLSSLPPHLLLLAEVSASSSDQVSHCAPSFRSFVAVVSSAFAAPVLPADGFLLLLQV